MGKLTREEQETNYNYDVINKCWYIYSTYPPHIRRIMERSNNVKAEKDEEGRIIYVEAVVKHNQVRLFKEQ